MSSFRSDRAGQIDRSRPIRFSFDGVEIRAFAGDTIASALLANDIAIVARSFKYHRPRGIWGAGVEEPNAIVDVQAPVVLRNCRATTELAVDGMVVTSCNASPTARQDRFAFIDQFARFIPSGFYYKTFMWPNWHQFEPRIRAMAGLGRLDPHISGPQHAEQRHGSCDLLIVGAGPAGLYAALLASAAGKSVVLCDDGLHMGGSLLSCDAVIDGKPAEAWLAATLATLRERGVRLLPRTTAFGIYDHGLVALNERRANGAADRLWKLRPTTTLLATGAIERPLPFINNDLPGIMSASAALAHFRRHGIVAGRQIIVASNNTHGFAVADQLRQAGAVVTLVDYRAGTTLVAAKGKGRVEQVELSDGRRLVADSVLVSGGFTPTLHLLGQARGKLAWDEKLLTFVPGEAVANLCIAGAAAGHFDLAALFANVRDVLSPADSGRAPVPALQTTQPVYEIIAAWPQAGSKGRIWVDLQHDVTSKDIELAARENFISVEHLKRYTTLGMATDQGKTSNLNGLALMAELTGRSIPEVGTTTYRPPFTPVPFTSLAGMRSAALMNPPRRLALEASHCADGAVLREYGGWLRPAYYGCGSEQDAVLHEAGKARETVALFDGSPLGKIEVIGPQAAEFLDFVYYNTVSTLKPGRCRYGFILNEAGIVYDDGVLVRLDEHRFIVSCSSSHVAGMHALLEEWRQDRFDRQQLFIHNVTADTATLTVSGPRSKQLLEKIGLKLSLDDADLPHMAIGFGEFDGEAVRVTRVSFTGDRSYELSIRADRAAGLWQALKVRGAEFDAVLLGVEALMVLRAEKGFIVIGKDSDGMTRPMDLGVTAPLARKKGEYLGRHSLFLPEAQRSDRQQLVGLEVTDGGAMLATGAHGVAMTTSGKRSIGYVTSSYFSPALGRPIALALIERGASRLGEVIDIQHLGTIRKARIAPVCAFDPSGGRLND